MNTLIKGHYYRKESLKMVLNWRQIQDLIREEALEDIGRGLFFYRGMSSNYSSLIEEFLKTRDYMSIYGCWLKPYTNKKIYKNRLYVFNKKVGGEFQFKHDNIVFVLVPDVPNNKTASIMENLVKYIPQD